MRPTILIAIADTPVAEAHEKYFGLKGFDVLRVGGGTDCWEVLNQRQPDVLILDEALPWGGGDGVLSLLREDASTISLPVVLHGNSVPNPVGTTNGRTRSEDVKYPVVARVERTSPMPVVMNAVLLGIGGFRPDKISDRESQLDSV